MPLNPFAAITERVADGVWRHAGDFRRSMNVYLVEEEGGVFAFDAGTEMMTDGVARAAAELGGLRRVVLGHSHADHRGTAPGLGVPVLCHPAEVGYAETDEGGVPPYFDLGKDEIWYSRLLYPHLLRRWDGGAVEIADTLEEGDRIGEFEVRHLPGHAPGLIALWRERDRLALVSDVIYLVDAARLRAADHPRVPHPMFNHDTELARDSVRRLAALEPRIVCPGHNEPLVGEPEQLRATLECAAATT